MLTQERHGLILQAIENRKVVTVVELTKELDASESTIRRDLNYLHEQGKLIKVHGGATAIEGEFTNYEQDIATKSSLNIDEKEAIGKYAATMIHEDDFVYIDAGTTTDKLVDAITNNGAVFVTNGISHAKKLTQKGCTVYVIGGAFKLATEAIVGIEGIYNLQKYNFTKCFLGGNGVAKEHGITTPDMEEGILKKEAAKRSHTVFILADHTKFGRICPVTFADMEDVVIITGHKVEESYKKKAVIKEVFE